MFVAHYGVGFAGKRGAPQVSLGLWCLALQLVDLLGPIFLLLGGEEVVDPPFRARPDPS